MLIAELGGETLCGALGGDGVEAEAFGGCVPQAVALEEVEGARAGDDGLDGLGREHLDRLADAVDVAACLAVDAVGQAHDRDRQGDVGLHRRDDVRRRRALLAQQAEQAIARLRQGGEGLERLERRSQAPSVVPVVAPQRRAVLGGGGTHRNGRHGPVIGRVGATV